MDQSVWITWVDSSRQPRPDRKSTRLNSSHSQISYAVFCLKKKKNYNCLKTSSITPPAITSTHIIRSPTYTLSPSPTTTESHDKVSRLLIVLASRHVASYH